MMTCSAPADCAEIERRRSTGIGLLADGGASRGNLLSGDADEVILTVSRMEAENAGEPRVPGVLRQRFQCHAGAGAVRLGGDARVDCRDPRDSPGRQAARSPRRDLSVPARRDVRDRARPDRLRRAHRHDARPARRLRDLLFLRRGRPSLGPRTRRHARGAAQARPAVRANRTRPALRPAAVRDRRPLRPRPDPGGDVQAAKRLRARRAGRALALERRGRRVRGRRRAERDGRSRDQRGDRSRHEKEAEERCLRSPGGRARLGQPRVDLPDGGARAG